MEHFRKLEQMYLSAPIQQLTPDISIKIEPGSSEIRMGMRPEFHHAAGAVHGSFYFRMLDDSAFFAVNSLVEDVFVLTASFHTELLRPVVSGELTARGQVLHQSKRLFIAESVILDKRDRKIGIGRGHFVRSEIPLESVPGYAGLGS